MGALSVLAGIVVLIYPGETLLILSIILGIWLVVYGAMEIFAALRFRGLAPVSRRTPRVRRPRGRARPAG
jgi:uncharacterized membrane protein HdeD (DUF308 family)